MTRLTTAQLRYLERIRKNPGIEFNGRAGRVLDNLKAKGLIRYEFSLEPHAIGSWGQTYKCWEVKP